jgi:hypothetical protein
VPEHVREEMPFHPVMSLGEVLGSRSSRPSAPHTSRMTRCPQCSPVPEEVRRAAGLLEGAGPCRSSGPRPKGASRFNELKQAVGEIPPRTLAQRLVELEAAGLLERRVIDARPPRVEYRLTEDGDRLRAVLDALGAYAGAV